MQLGWLLFHKVGRGDVADAIFCVRTIIESGCSSVLYKFTTVVKTGEGRELGRLEIKRVVEGHWARARAHE